MKNRIAPLFALALTASFGGCSNQADDLDNATFVQELKGGCKMVCPKCTPSMEVCSKALCYEDCNGKGKAGQTGGSRGEPCGDNVCAVGDVCCNASCGICTPPDGACIMMACAPKPAPACNIIALCVQGYVWDDKNCECGLDTTPAPGSCTTDNDCRVFSDYCTGCDCRALGVNEADPVCDGPGVRCFADPCMNQAAACVNGACTLTTTVQ